MSGDLWALTPELQKRYNEIVAHTRRLQAELGITPMTLEQRLEQGRQRKIQRELEEQERLRRQREAEQYLAKAPSLRLPARRPL